jgi:hypothetical protein
VQRESLEREEVRGRDAVLVRLEKVRPRSRFPGSGALSNQIATVVQITRADAVHGDPTQHSCGIVCETHGVAAGLGAAQSILDVEAVRPWAFAGCGILAGDSLLARKLLPGSWFLRQRREGRVDTGDGNRGGLWLLLLAYSLYLSDRRAQHHLAHLREARSEVTPPGDRLRAIRGLMGVEGRHSAVSRTLGLA